SCEKHLQIEFFSDSEKCDGDGKQFPDEMICVFYMNLWAESSPIMKTTIDDQLAISSAADAKCCLDRKIVGERIQKMILARAVYSKVTCRARLKVDAAFCIFHYCRS
ncbi:MAG: hypothetical protein ACM34C_02770, partial [Syntrophaceae bacterium]